MLHFHSLSKYHRSIRPVPGGGEYAGSIDFFWCGFLTWPIYLVFGMGHRRFWIFCIRDFLSFYQGSWKCHFLVCMGMYREMEKPWFKNVVRKTIGWYRNNFFGSIRHQITLENGNLVFFPTFLYFRFLSQRKQAIL